VDSFVPSWEKCFTNLQNHLCKREGGLRKIKEEGGGGSSYSFENFYSRYVKISKVGQKIYKMPFLPNVPIFV
jgi:hypothetical protein